MIDPAINRRRFLRTTGTAGLVAAVGCIDVNNPYDRSLSFSTIELIETSRSKYVVNVAFKKSAQGSSEQWETFHDVRLLGYTKQGDRVCEARLGDVSKNGRVGEERLSCNGFPFVITFDADEAPCGGETHIRVATYQGQREGRHFWIADRIRRCDEGLPPAVPDTTVTPP